MAPRNSVEGKRDAVRIARTGSLTMRQVSSDLGIGLSTLGKWVRAIAEEANLPEQAAGPRSVGRQRSTGQAWIATPDLA